MLVHEVLKYNAKIHPDKLALVYRDRRLTYCDIDSLSDFFCGTLIAEGFQRQDRAAIYLENCTESVISIFGILKAGGVFVVFNSKVKESKLSYLLSDCQAKVLITDLSHLNNVSTTSGLTYLKCIVIVDHENNTNHVAAFSGIKLLNFKEVLDRNLNIFKPPHCIDVDLACLIYTSGSSGVPRGVMLTHHNVISASDSIIQYLENTKNDIVLNALPLSFDYGLYQILMAFKFGGTVILENGFVFPEYILRTIVKEKVTGWPIVPTMVSILCRQRDLCQHDFSCLRYITSTGQALLINHIKYLCKVFPKTKIFSMYGLTECKRVSYLPPDQILQKPDSVGKAIPNTEVYLVDEDGNQITEAGQPGELVVRGSNVMQGYWNLPEATSKALKQGRYPSEKVLFSGDMFKMDQDGDLYFLGRKDDIIKTSGHMVSPKEVENVLCNLKDIVETAVIGVEDELLGKAIKAYVHLFEGSSLTEKEIINYCNKHLEDYAVPKYIVFCSLLPVSENEKILKRELR